MIIEKLEGYDNVLKFPEGGRDIVATTEAYADAFVKAMEFIQNQGQMDPNNVYVFNPETGEMAEMTVEELEEEIDQLLFEFEIEEEMPEGEPN